MVIVNTSSPFLLGTGARLRVPLASTVKWQDGTTGLCRPGAPVIKDSERMPAGATQQVLALQTWPADAQAGPEPLGFCGVLRRRRRCHGGASGSI